MIHLVNSATLYAEPSAVPVMAPFVVTSHEPPSPHSSAAAFTSPQCFTSPAISAVPPPTPGCCLHAEYSTRVGHPGADAMTSSDSGSPGTASTPSWFFAPVFAVVPGGESSAPSAPSAPSPSVVTPSVMPGISFERSPGAPPSEPDATSASLRAFSKISRSRSVGWYPRPACLACSSQYPDPCDPPCAPTSDDASCAGPWSV
mmetsp:Transcript_584/g.2068  ORF Transcript_584/g.2068 Transcript_584/m.2068 type:complete len:202 (+) Transcript_584:333-938(+)